jgi:hypothetical protein
MTAPCASCPWRLTSPEDGSGIPRFNLDLMRRLANTVGPGDAFRPIMACHGSACGAEVACRGYLQVEGWSNLSVRLALIDGAVSRADMDPEPGLALWPDFASMLAAYEEAG